MSHFTVLVATNGAKGVDDVMLPYHEYESTGIEQYIEKVYATQEEIDEMVAHYKEKIPDNTMTMDEMADDWAGWKKDDKGYYRMTNPNSKWDWYSVGGRWDGLLTLKDGKSANVAKKSELAIDIMIIENAVSAGKQWDMFDGGLKKLGSSMSELLHMDADKRGKFISGFNGNPPNGFSDEEWRDFYIDLMYFDWPENADDCDTHDKFVERFGKKSALTFAYVDLDGKWHERAQMGWFGMTRNPNDGFDDEYWEFIDGLPDEVTLTVLDCHI